MSQALHVFSIASNQNHHLDRLKCSADQFNIPLEILGLDQPYLGNGQKIVWVLEALETLPDDALFLYVDAYDVIFLTDASAIVSTYQDHYEGQVVYGAERNFGMYSWDDLWSYWRYPVKNSFFRFLNAGTFMGPVGKIRKIYQEIGLKRDQKSDQMDTIRYFIKNPHRLTVDTRHSLFAVTGGRVGLQDIDYRIEKNRLYSVQTNSFPCVFHVPGKFFPILDSIAYRLGIMNDFPQYSAQELKWLSQQSKDNRLCDRLGLEPYIVRLIKQWSLNFIYLAVLFLFIQLFRYLSDHFFGH